MNTIGTNREALKYNTKELIKHVKRLGDAGQVIPNCLLETPIESSLWKVLPGAVIDRGALGLWLILKARERFNTFKIKDPYYHITMCPIGDPSVKEEIAGLSWLGTDAKVIGQITGVETYVTLK